MPCESKADVLRIAVGVSKECIMRSTVQPGWMGIGRWVADIGMAFAILLLLVVVATRPVQAKSFSVLYAFKGGTDAANVLATSELFDPALNLFEIGAPMASPRSGHAATRLLDGRVLVTGGRNALGGGGTVLNSAEIYNGPP